jgi:branched-chain amino acid transport system substrate-binding protein
MKGFQMRRIIAGALAAMTAIGLAACGSSGSSSNGADTSVAKNAPIKLGVLTSLTGPASSAYTTVEEGVKARLALQNAQGGIDGHKLTFVMGDDQSTTQGAQSGTLQLIQQDKVYGILDVSNVFVGAAETAKQFNIPVAGVSFDAGPEWFSKSYTNLFDALGYKNFNVVATSVGSFFKSVGATKVAAVGFAGSISSGSSATEAVLSSVHAGLSKAYLNVNVPFGTTNVGPIVQAIKASGANSLYMPMVPSTAFAIVVGLRQAGVKMKAVVSANGYGGDLLSDKSALSAANGVYFGTFLAPIESGTAATKQFQAAMATYAGVRIDPTFGEYMGWITADLFIHGLKLAGPTASSAQFISKLRASTWNGGGLEAPTNFADVGQGAGGSEVAGNCFYVTQLAGGKFINVPGEPFCGTIIPGLKA